MRLSSLIVAALVMVAVACGGGDRKYPEQVRQNFLSACTASGGTSAQCNCALEEVEKKYTLAEFTELEQQIVRGENVDELTDLILKCRGD